MSTKKKKAAPTLALPRKLDPESGPWTEFMDMHSGGGQKLDWPYIFIEAPEKEARAIFARRFGREPDNVTCDCCGSDYSVSEAETLAQATAYERSCDFDKTTAKWVEMASYRAKWHPYRTVEDYVREATEKKGATFIAAADLTDKDRAAAFLAESFGEGIDYAETEEEEG